MCAGGGPLVRPFGASSGGHRSNRVRTDPVGEVVAMFGVWWFSGFKELSTMVGDDTALEVSRVNVAVARTNRPPRRGAPFAARLVGAAGEAPPLSGSASPAAQERPVTRRPDPASHVEEVMRPGKRYVGLNGCHVGAESAVSRHLLLPFLHRPRGWVVDLPHRRHPLGQGA
jgi:hypothetical protein